jgi:hypothetical protein
VRGRLGNWPSYRDEIKKKEKKMAWKEDNQWAGRTKRHISLVIGAIIMLGFLGAVSIGSLIYLIANYKDIIDPIAVFIIIVAVILPDVP